MATDLIKNFIASSLWGKNLTAEQLRRVENETSELVTSAGQTVCHRGVRSDYWYGVAEGLVKVSNVSCSGRPTTLIGIPTGGWFGEGSVLKNEIRPYDVVALRGSRLSLVPAATFHWLLGTSLPFNRFLIDQLNARLAQFVIRVEHSRSFHPDRHVAHCLSELFNTELYPGTATTLQISQEEIAFLAGVSRQLANRALRRLEDEKLLEVSYGSVRIINVEALRAFAAEQLEVTVVGRTSRLEVTNSPAAGPVFSGERYSPWICARPTATTVTVSAPDDPSLTGTTTTRVSGLASAPVDDACSTKIEYLYYYQPRSKVGSGCTLTATGANPCFVQYDPAARPNDADIADFTNDRGITVKSLLRLEKGTINRSLYNVLAYFDPARPWHPWAPQQGWNGKLLWKMGASTGVGHHQAAPPVAAVFDENALTAGYMVANTTLTEHSLNNNELLAAETLMMTKEHVIEAYGPIRYTVSDGGSGGSMMQTVTATVMPGLLDGLLVADSFPDSVSTWNETQDCVLLQGKYFGTPAGSVLTSEQRAAITGKPVGTDGGAYCNAWARSWSNSFNGSFVANCLAGFPASIVYDPVTRRKGVRCSLNDVQRSQWGTFVDTDGNTKTKWPYDNVGVQYGLIALKNNSITPEQFVQLNEGVGSLSADAIWSGGDPKSPTTVAARGQAQVDVLPTIYRSGMIADAKQLAKVPMIDLRVERGPDIHQPWRSMEQRDRLIRANGNASNQVIRGVLQSAAVGPSSAPADNVAATRQVFKMMDRWLTAIEANKSDDSIEVKVVRNKPLDVTDACFASPGNTDAEVAPSKDVGFMSSACPVQFAVTSPRVVAGGPLAENILKCQLKPFNADDPDYGGAMFTSTQRARLSSLFSSGVCDWSKSGVGQTAAEPTLSFQAGPGGTALPPAPVWESLL